MSKLTRRQFIGGAAVATGACVVGGIAVERVLDAEPAFEKRLRLTINRSIKNPTDKVRLGKSGLKVSVVGIGTGSIGYARHSNQTRLGQDVFTRLMRHSLDQ